MFKKGIILAAGRSTRLYPATIVIGKPLLPIFDKPMIYYSLAILMQAQIKEICIVTNPHNLHLFQELLGNGDSWGIHIEYRIQQEAKGIADVFNVAADFIQNQPCALVLGDNIFIGTNWKARFEQIQSQPAYGAHVFARPVSDPERYGVITLDENQKPLDLIEKPNPAPSNLAVTGLYFYDEQASDLAKQLKPSARGELEITDLNRLYLNQQQLHLHQLNQNDDDSLGFRIVETVFIKNLPGVSRLSNNLNIYTQITINATTPPVLYYYSENFRNTFCEVIISNNKVKEKELYKVEKMRFGKNNDKSTLVFNKNII